jgi:hypothetical protein
MAFRKTERGDTTLHDRHHGVAGHAIADDCVDGFAHLPRLHRAVHIRLLVPYHAEAAIGLHRYAGWDGGYAPVPGVFRGYASEWLALRQAGGAAVAFCDAAVHCRNRVFLPFPCGSFGFVQHYLLHGRRRSDRLPVHVLGDSH